MSTAKVERKPNYLWSAMVNAACDLYPEELVKEIRQAYDRGLVNPGDVSYSEVEAILKAGKAKALEDTLKYQKGMIGNVIEEMGWWACFRKCDEEDSLDMDPFVFDDDFYLPTVKTVVRSGSARERWELIGARSIRAWWSMPPAKRRSLAPSSVYGAP